MRLAITTRFRDADGDDPGSFAPVPFPDGAILQFGEAHATIPGRSNGGSAA